MKKDTMLFKKMFGIACTALLLCSVGCKNDDDSDDDETTTTVSTTAISIAAGASSLSVDGRTTLTATLTPSDSTDTVSWTVTQDGTFVSLSAETGTSVVLTALASGSATITATAGSVTSDAITITVASDPDAEETAYTANVTMATGDTYVPKGFVFLNSELQIESGETAYLSRTGGSSYYDQVAFINTSITGEGTFASTFYKDSSNAKETITDDHGNYHVGWKDYNTTKDGFAVSTEDRYSGAGTISETLYKAEYADREVILNRVYDLTQSGYAAADDVWDISALKTEFGITD